MKTNPFHQTVIVTGGATGIGYAVAAQFVEREANVLLNGRTRAKLAGAAEKLGNSDRVAFIAADITQPANAQTIVDALERFGRLDVLVNNAGIFYNKPFTDYSRRCSADRTGGEINVRQANARLALAVTALKNG